MLKIIKNFKKSSQEKYNKKHTRDSFCSEDSTTASQHSPTKPIVSYYIIRVLSIPHIITCCLFFSFELHPEQQLYEQPGLPHSDAYGSSKSRVNPTQDDNTGKNSLGAYDVPSSTYAFPGVSGRDDWHVRVES